jgi:hypothetical protein
MVEDANEKDVVELSVRDITPPFATKSLPQDVNFVDETDILAFDAVCVATMEDSTAVGVTKEKFEEEIEIAFSPTPVSVNRGCVEYV